MVKNPSASAGDIRDMGSISGLGRSPGGGHGNPPQYSCLENPMDRGGWWATVHGAAKSWTQLSSSAHTAKKRGGEIARHRSKGTDCQLRKLSPRDPLYTMVCALNNTVLCTHIFAKKVESYIQCSYLSLSLTHTHNDNEGGGRKPLEVMDNLWHSL